MVSNQVVTGINIWWIAVMTITPALITGVVSIIISRVQLKMKISELKGESEYKARENLFRLYEEKIRVLRESKQQFSESFGKTLGYYLTTEDKQEKMRLLKIMLDAGRLLKDEMAGDIDEIEGELKKHKLFTKENEGRISFMRKIISINLEKIPERDMEAAVMSYHKVADALGLLENILLEKKRDELFSKYLT